MFGDLYDGRCKIEMFTLAFVYHESFLVFIRNLYQNIQQEIEKVNTNFEINYQFFWTLFYMVMEYKLKNGN